jgi:molecular chaperone GrpE
MKNGTAEEEQSSGPQSEPPEDEIKTDRNLKSELADMRDRWMRSEAENANIRSRAKRDVEEARQFGLQKFATDVVEAADNLLRGIEAIPSVSVGNDPQLLVRVREGLVDIERGFVSMLKRNGINKEDPVGQAFDPQRHEAMSTNETAEYDPGTVMHAMSSTWTLNGRLLRPAMVVVAKLPSNLAKDKMHRHPTH